MKHSRPVLEARALQISIGGTLILDVPSLAIEEGEVLALIGPNGAGKTTLLHTLCSLLKPSRGEIYFQGEKVSGPSDLAYRRRLAMVFQEALLLNTTVWQNVASGVKIRKEAGPAVERKVRENLERFGIFHLADRSARKISGGEAQRVALARALATEPEILFLDEPFSALDPPTRENLLEDLERVLRQTRTTTVMSTHDRLEALRIADRIAVMHEGKILQAGPPGEVMSQPVSEFVASFVGVETILIGRVTANNGGSFTASVMGREVEAIGAIPPGEAVVLCIRPENVTLALAPLKERSSARNLFPGTIRKITPLGLYYRVHLDCGFPLVAYVTHHSLESLSLEGGKEVWAAFKATAVHVVRRTDYGS